MAHDEAKALGWPPSHLRLVPDPSPGDRALHLSIAIKQAVDAFGPNDSYVQELKVKFDAAMKEAVAQSRLGRKP